MTSLQELYGEYSNSVSLARSIGILEALLEAVRMTKPILPNENHRHKALLVLLLSPFVLI